MSPAPLDRAAGQVAPHAPDSVLRSVVKKMSVGGTDIHDRGTAEPAEQPHDVLKDWQASTSPELGVFVVEVEFVKHLLDGGAGEPGRNKQQSAATTLTHPMEVPEHETRE